MSLIKKYFQNQIESITTDKTLQLYGAFIALGYLVAYAYWILFEMARQLNNRRICWPFFDNCFQYQPPNAQYIDAAFYGFVFISALCALIFLVPRYCKLAYWTLAVLAILNLLIYFQDFQFRSNQITIINWVAFTFLFWPHKRNALRYLLVMIYFCSSLLKYNAQWISGVNLYGDPLFIPPTLIPAACIYVIILESFLVFGLLSRNKWIFWGVYIQFMIFHLVSWSVVGFFYPLLMFAMLTIFPLTFLNNTKTHSNRIVPTTFVLISLLLVLQCFRLTFPGDVRTTSEGRLFGLDMFDSNTQCIGDLKIKFKNGDPITMRIPFGMPLRFRCDPVVYFSTAKQQCFKYRHDPNFKDVDIEYSAWQKREKDIRTLVDVEDFCSKDLRYDMLKTNDWITKE